MPESMFTYPRVLRAKDLKRISKYPCGDEIKDAYIRYLTNYSFSEFAEFCKQNSGRKLEDSIFRFTDLQLEKFEVNSLIWVSHVMINFLIYFNVNLDYGENYDAYASALQFTVLNCAMQMSMKKIPFGEVPLSQHSKDCFKRLFEKVPDFRFNLKNDCNLAYRSFNEKFDFTEEEFYLKVSQYFDESLFE